MLYYRLGTVLSTEGGSQGARRVHITPSSLAGRSSLARRTGKSGVVAISGDEPHRVLLYLVSACDGGQTAPASDHRSGGRIAAALGSVHGRPTSAGNHLRDNCYVCRGIGCQESQRQVDQCGDDSQAHSHTPANPRSAWSARSATAECSGIARCAAFARWAAAKKIARDQSVFSRGITGNPHGSRCDHAVIRDISDTCVGLVAMCGAHRIQHGAAYWFDTGITLGSFRRLPVALLPPDATKTGQPLLLYANAECRCALQSLRDYGDEHVLPWRASPHSLHCARQRVWNRVLPVNRRWGFHAIRRTTLNWAAGVNPLIARLIAGHSCGDTLRDHYVDPRSIADLLDCLPPLLE